MPDSFDEKDSMALNVNDLPGLRPYQPLQVFFLLRLGRLLRLRQNVAGSAEAAEWLMRLLGKAIYSTYRDCLEIGVGDDARALFTKIAAERHS